MKNVLRGMALLAPVFVLAACASPAPPATPGSPDPGSTTGGPTADLEVVVVRTPGEPEQKWILKCSGAEPLAGSTHPMAGDACALVAATPELFAPPPKNRLCTQQYGGPDVATVTGTVAGTAVDRTFSRTDGCEIAAWNSAVALLGQPGGAV